MKEKPFTKLLEIEHLFPSPIWKGEAPQFVKSLNKASEPYIKKAKKNMKDQIKERNKVKGMTGDLGFVYHSTTLIGDPGFKLLSQYILGTAFNLLNEQGYCLEKHQLFLTELWVQEFAKDGGGHHSLHTHYNGHISGFYFLKCSDKTSYPIFENPRPGKQMMDLPEKDRGKKTEASNQISYKVQPGSMIFFPSYLPHLFTVDEGIEPFRFIHWNIQAIPKTVLNVKV
tara:strand:- start:1543 stop:2223 length:681 start_codon:yes stop_codon:yes gene_type:complete